MKSGSKLPIAYAPLYRLPLPENHRFPMEKYELLPLQLLHEGCCQESDFFIPKAVDRVIVEAVHQKNYVQRLLDLNLNKAEIRKIGFPLSAALIEREFIIAGGTLEGCQKAFHTGVALNIAGGTHHAYAGHGEAFCLLNDQAIAAQYLLDQKKTGKILIVDLDVHQGNGTAAIFENEKRVFTFSMHGAKNYPFHKEKSDLDIPLPDGTTDSTFLELLEKTLPALIHQEQPDFIFYLSGVDVLETDRLGRIALSLEGCKKRDEMVFALCKEHRIPVQCSMGGGYSKTLKIILEAHANTFRVAQSIFD